MQTKNEKGTPVQSHSVVVQVAAAHTVSSLPEPTWWVPAAQGFAEVQVG